MRYRFVQKKLAIGLGRILFLVFPGIFAVAPALFGGAKPLAAVDAAGLRELESGSGYANIGGAVAPVY